MIRAELFRSPDGLWTGYELRGHADWADAGRDIVCAAASMLAINCVNSLETVCQVQAQVKDGDGRLSVALPEKLKPAQAHDAQVLLAALCQGLRDLQEAYPHNIQFSIVNGGKHP